MILLILIYVMILSVFAAAPFLIQVVGFTINAVFPDPIPFLDEFIMILSMWYRIATWLERAEKIVEFKEEHPRWFWVILLILIIIILLVIVRIYRHFSGGG